MRLFSSSNQGFRLTILIKISISSLHADKDIMIARITHSLQSVKPQASQLLKVFRKHKVFLLSAYVIAISLTLLSSYLSNLSFSSPSPVNLLISFMAPVSIQFACLMLITFISFFVMPFFIQKNLEEESRLRVYTPHTLASFFKQNFACWLRGMSKVLVISYLFLFMLIVPGIYKMLKCAFVSSIILFNKHYKHGEVSAIKLSHRLTKGYMIKIASLGFFYVASLSALSYFLKGLTTSSLSLASISVTSIEIGCQFLGLLLFGSALHFMYMKSIQVPQVTSTSSDEPLSIDTPAEISNTL